MLLLNYVNLKSNNVKNSLLIQVQSITKHKLRLLLLFLILNHKIHNANQL